MTGVICTNLNKITITVRQIYRLPLKKNPQMILEYYQQAFWAFILQRKPYQNMLYKKKYRTIL